MLTPTETRPLGPGADLRRVFELAQQLRVDSIRASSAAGSGHPTSSLSAADVVAVLAARHLRYDWQDPANPGNDHLILSKGHASPLLYALFKAAGVIGEQELLTTYRRAGARLQGHPTPVLPWVDLATGSLGQGDATSAASLTATMARLPGISYLRATRGAYPVFYGAGERFPVGGSKTLRSAADDRITLAGTGVTVHTCLDAAERLAAHGVPARVLDLYSVKPVDADVLLRAGAETGAIVVAEDHHAQGGLGEAVLAALAARGAAVPLGGWAHLAVRELPGSGTPDELLDAAGISGRRIAEAALTLLGGSNPDRSSHHRAVSG